LLPVQVAHAPFELRNTRARVEERGNCSQKATKTAYKTAICTEKINHNLVNVKYSLLSNINLCLKCIRTYGTRVKRLLRFVTQLLIDYYPSMRSCVKRLVNIKKGIPRNLGITIINTYGILLIRDSRTVVLVCLYCQQLV